MFDLSLGEMLVIGILVLVFFDADQLPELMRKAGRIYGQIRGASDDLRRAFNAEVARVDAERRRDEMQRRREELMRARQATKLASVEPEGDAVPRAPPRSAPDVLPRPDALPRPEAAARPDPAEEPAAEDAPAPPKEAS